MRRNEEKRVAVIGGGAWGKNLIRNFHDLGVLHTVCDSDGEALERHRVAYPEVGLERSHQRVFESPDIAAVVIATPAPTHAALAREALLADKDVYVEKPLCLSEDDGRELNRLADAHHKILMVGHLLWYHPAVLRLKELVSEGALGRIHYIYSTRLNLGRLRREENVLWSFAPHDVSVILGLVGESPESVQAQGGNFLHRQIADTTVTLFTFPSGVQAHIFVSWLHPYKEQKLVVVGDQRMAVFDDTAASGSKLKLFAHSIEWKGNVPTANKAPAVGVEVLDEEPLRAECRHFLDCIAKRTTPRTDGREGLAVLRVLNACQKALRTGGVVPVEPGPGELAARLATRDEPSKDGPLVHPTAEVDGGVELGAGTRVWHFSHILTDSKIGPKCSIGQNAMIGPRVTVGSGCKIQNNVSIYEGVTLEDDVFCGPSMVFTNVLNPRSHVSRKHEFRPTLVRRGSTIGANATIICGSTLGKYSFIGAGSVVTRDVPDHALFVGNPARQVGWMCGCGERLEDDLRCASCGTTYRESAAGLTPIDGGRLASPEALDRRGKVTTTDL